MERQLSSQDCDKDLQLQEMLCLSSLLAPEEFHQSTESSGTLDIYLTADHGFRVFAPNKAEIPAVVQHLSAAIDFGVPNDRKAFSEYVEKVGKDVPSCAVKNLPGLQVTFTFPDDYPSQSPPRVGILCPWLHQNTLRNLENEVTHLWKKAGKLAVIYTAYGFLMDIMENRHFFPYGPVLVLVPDEDHGLGIMILCANILRVKETTEALTAFLLWNTQRADVLFQKNVQQCTVCLISREGAEFRKLTNCGHWICPDCLKSACETHISEGSLRLIRCFECSAEIHSFDVNSIVGDEQKEKYQRVQLNHALDGMGDIAYCPRQGCGIAVVGEKDNIAKCVCGFAFCTLCQKSSHGVAPCYNGSFCSNAPCECGNFLVEYNPVIEVTALEQQLSAADPEEKEYVRRRLLEALSEAKLHVLLQSKRCPNCSRYLQKISGCNHIVCPCGRHLCWSCMIEISNVDPYSHFRNNNRCSTRLWDEENPLAARIDNEAVIRDLDNVAEQLLSTPERWFDQAGMEQEMRTLLRRQLQGDGG